MAKAGNVPRWAVIASAVACTTLIAGLLATRAAAFHIPGADYSGSVSGGGSISFRVSGDGSSVTNLTLHGPITGPGCSLDSKQYTEPSPITNNTFNNGEVSGGFPNPRGAYGRFSIVVSSLLSSCRIAGTWSAITSASPNGSAECKQAQAEVKKAKRVLQRAERAGNEAKIGKLRKKWDKARSKRDQFCL